MPTSPSRKFLVFCCGRSRGVFPGGVLVCSRCDYTDKGVTVLPNERYAKDVPSGVREWEVPRA